MKLVFTLHHDSHLLGYTDMQAEQQERTLLTLISSNKTRIIVYLVLLFIYIFVLNQFPSSGKILRRDVDVIHVLVDTIMWRRKRTSIHLS